MTANPPQPGAARLFLACAGILALALCGCGEKAAPPLRNDESPTPVVGNAADALDLIQRYNARDLRAPGTRTVKLELKDRGRTTAAYVIENRWQSNSGGLFSSFGLREPVGSAGTCYLLHQRQPPGEYMEVHFFVPAGRQQVLKIAPQNFDDALLGSDFGYHDLCWRLAVNAGFYKRAGETMLDGTEVTAVDFIPVGGDAHPFRFARIRYYFHRDLTFLQGADYWLSADDDQPAKRLRVEAFAERDGIKTATRITMTGRDGQSSVMSLLNLQLRQTQGHAMPLTPAELGSYADALREGKP